MTPEHARAIASSAYVFLSPLVVMYGAMYRQAIEVSSSRYTGFGRWSHAELGRRADGGRTASSIVWLDLRSEPWVASVPTFGSGVSFECRWLDLWSFEVEAVPAGGGHGHDLILVAAPSWGDEPPGDVDGVVRGESSFVCGVASAQLADVADSRSVIGALDGSTIEPLSAHVGVAPPEPVPTVRWWPWRLTTQTSEEFWSCAAFALTLTTPHQQDLRVLERIAEIGVIAGRPWDPVALGDEIVDAIGAGMDDALTDFMRAAQGHGAVVDVRTRDATDRDYFGRALDAQRRGPRLGARHR